MYTITGQGDNTSAYIMHLQCLTLAEIKDLPKSPTCDYGSDCLCIEDSSVWVLGTDNEWHQI